jgi:hypothetical protein
LQEALRIKGSYPKVMNRNKAIKEGNKEISPHAPPQKNKTPVIEGLEVHSAGRTFQISNHNFDDLVKIRAFYNKFCI